MRSPRDESGQASGYILGVQKLTMSRGVRLWFGDGFCGTEAPRGQMEVEWGAKVGRGPGTQPRPLQGASSLFSRSVSVTGV